jgi:hypothetical protein
MVQEARELAISGKPSELAAAYKERGIEQRAADEKWARGDDDDDGQKVAPPDDGQCLELSRLYLTPSGEHRQPQREQGCRFCSFG